MENSILSQNALHSSRSRVLKHLLRQKAVFDTAKSASSNPDDDDPGPNAPKGLDPGQMQLKSYFAPLMQGGHEYTISVTQKVETADGKAKMSFNPSPSTQGFFVHASRFALPPGIVHSTYPPQGLGDHNDILPHIVFNDPHLPWENSGSPKQDAKDDNASTPPRNKVPWLVLLTFTEDELKLLDSELQPKSLKGLFPEVMQVPPKVFPPLPAPPLGRQQDKSTFSMKLTMNEYLEMGGSIPPAGGGNASEAVITPIIDNEPEKIDSATQVDVIFPHSSYVNNLLASYDSDGAKRQIPAGQTVAPDLSGLKYLAHVRNVNTQNIPGAGLDDNGLFSVIIANRPGPLDLTTPKPVIVHLVTLEGLEAPEKQKQRIMLPLDANKRVAFVSLYSWTYLCLPPDQVNFVDAMRHIGFDIKANNCWLRTSSDALSKFQSKLPKDANGNPTPPSTYTPQQKITARLIDRLTDGYNLQRYRIQTGEESVAFYRGPFTPKYVSTIQDSWWPYQSNFSSDYQILDRQLGIMDISYSAAWQLGRTLAVANQAFTAALVRLRGVIHTTGRRGALKDLSPHTVKSKMETLASMPKTVEMLSALASGPASAVTAQPKNRHQLEKSKALQFHKTANQSISEPIDTGDVYRALVEKHIHKAAKKLGGANMDMMKRRQPNAYPSYGQSSETSSSEGLSSDASSDESSDEEILPKPTPQTATVRKQVIGPTLKASTPATHPVSFVTTTSSPDDEVVIPWNDISVPVSTDWQIVQNWILDNMFFKNIPAHYLIPDPSYLPPESMRFFYVDNNWVECFIDGALSVGNHLDRKDDVVRQAFKNNLNNYFVSKYSDTHPDHPNFTYHPQIPCFGFLLRSAVVKAFPDLEIHCPWKSADDSQGKREPVLRYETIAPDTLLCLFDRMPGQDHWDSNWQITLSQPPHQQCFRIGTPGGLTTSELEVEFPAVYTDTRNRQTISDRYAPLRIVKWHKDRSSPTENDNGVDVNVTDVPHSVFDWDSRSIIPNAFAAASQTIISNDMQDPPAGKPNSIEYYTEKSPTSAMVGNVLTSYISKIKMEIPTSTSASAPPDYTVSPRQIRMPAPVTDTDTLQPVPPHTDDEPGNDPAPSPPTPPTSDFTPPVYRFPDTPSGFDPNTEQPNIPIPQCVIPPLPPSQAKIDGFTAQFSAVIFPLATAPPGSPPPAPPARAIPLVTLPVPTPGSPDDIPIDLVVRLSRQPAADTTHKLQLFSIRVRIPVGPSATDILRTDHLSSARMLRNARFNVHVSRGTSAAGRPFLELSVIPRAAGKLVPLSNVGDASFVVGQVRVCAAKGTGTVEIRENYRWQNGADKGGGYQLLDAVNRVKLVKSGPGAK